jgi:hypothetical protein
MMTSHLVSLFSYLSLLLVQSQIKIQGKVLVCYLNVIIIIIIIIIITLFVSFSGLMCFSFSVFL